MIEIKMAQKNEKCWGCDRQLGKGELYIEDMKTYSRVPLFCLDQCMNKYIEGWGLRMTLERSKLKEVTNDAV
jgi:hypothetical protein